MCAVDTLDHSHTKTCRPLLTFIIPEKVYEQVDMLIPKKQVLQILYIKRYVLYSRLFSKKKISNN